MGAWKIRYEGELHKELWNHMVKLYESDLDKDFKYANMCAIIQSSGTGKSRMVDKLGMSHFVIPLCLREDGTTGASRKLRQPSSTVEALVQVSRQPIQ